MNGKKWDDEQLNPNCSETTYEVPIVGIKKQLGIVKKLIMDGRIVLDIGNLKVISHMKDLKEIRKIIPEDEYKVYGGMLRPDQWKKILQSNSLEEVRPKIAKLFGELVLLGETAKGENTSYYVILEVRWYPSNYIADSDITMEFGEESKDWKLELNFENRGPEEEVNEAVNQIENFVTKLKYVDES